MRGYFEAHCRDNLGRAHKRLFYAYESHEAYRVRKDLFAQGLRAVDIVWREHSFLAALKTRFNMEAQAEFLDAVHAHVKMGDGPSEALRNAIESLEGELRARFEPAVELLRSGGRGGDMNTLVTDALEQTGLFSLAALSTLRAAERSGDIKSGLQEAKDYLLQHHSNWKLMMIPVTTLGWEITTGLSSVWYLKYVQIPKSLKEPPTTQDAAALADWTAMMERTVLYTDLLYWGTIIFMATVFIVASFYILGERPVRAKMDRVLVRVPIVRQLMLDNAFAISFSIAGRMLKGRAKRAEAVRLARDLSFVPLVQSFWDKILQKLSMGAELSDAIDVDDGTLLNSAERRKLRVNLTSEHLSQMLVMCGEARSSRMAKNIKRLIKATWLIYAIYVAAICFIAYNVMSGQLSGVTTSIDGSLD